jgi:stress response protein YsnF
VVLVLHEEVPEVRTAVVPVERVTVHVDAIPDSAVVSTAVAREVVDVHQDPRPSTPPGAPGSP